MTNNQQPQNKVTTLIKLTELMPVYHLWKGKNLFFCKGYIYVG